ncbi:MAG: SCO1664 family protein [Anaerolineaceae bacterium]|nr:SCO1664 family protein [Anaerolineaceae bacterium]
MTALQKGEITLQGQFLNSSNYTFLGTLNHQDIQFRVVYKPARGERPLWDFPAASLARREAAAYLVSEALGWDLVPPTVYRRQKMPIGAGSLQQYIEHDPEYHYFTFTPEDRLRLQPAVLFDLLVNNADRKGGHILMDAGRHLWLIDHGVCFHEEDKLRTVIWDFGGKPTPEELRAGIQRFYQELESGDALCGQLSGLLSGAELGALKARACRLAVQQTFPTPDQVRRPFPWPPV